MDGTPISQDLFSNNDLHQHVPAWLRANEIEPNDIPSAVHPSLVGDQLTAEVFARNGQGQIQFDPSGNEAARETKTFTVTVQPPPDVAEWLRPRCSECGR